MLSITYSSAALQPFSQDDLLALLEQSRSSNEQDGLTGVLVYRDDRFLQLLEGPDDVVRERMRVIEADDRHGTIRVLLEDEIEERQFPDWTMGFVMTDNGDVQIPGYRRTFDDIDSNRSTSGSLPALRALISWFRAQHDA